jgi:hypothetical protein
MSCGESTWGLTHSGEATGGRVWWTPAAAAAGSFAPASRQLGRANKRAWELCWSRSEAGVACVGIASGRSTEFTEAAPMADGGACLCSREEKGKAAFTAGSRRLGVPCTLRRKEVVQGAAWAVGRPRRAWSPAKYGGATTGRAAWWGRVARADRESRAVRLKWEGSTARGPEDRVRPRRAGPARRRCRRRGRARSGALESKFVSAYLL